MNEVRRKEDRQQCANRSTHLPSLRAVRQSRGLTQRELGVLAGVSRGTVQRLETGARGAYAVTLRKLAAALGVTPSELVLGRRH